MAGLQMETRAYCCPECEEMDRLEAEQQQRRRGDEMSWDEWFAAMVQWSRDADALLQRIRALQREIREVDEEYADLWDPAVRAERNALWRARLEEAESALDTGCDCGGRAVLVEEYGQSLVDGEIVETWRMVPVCLECGARGR